jgi:formate dehydrogenase
VADHAAPRHDPTHLRLLAVGAEPLRRRGRGILEAYFAGTSIRDEYLIVDAGKLAGAGAHSYSTRS